MQFISARASKGNIEVDVDLSNQEVADFRTRHDAQIRRRLPGVVEFYHPLDHAVRNCLRVVVVGHVESGETAEIVGRRIYDDLTNIMKA